MIQIEDEEASLKNLTLIEQFCTQAAALCGASTQESISINFISTKKMTELNAQYRHKDMPTDVLSFAFREGGTWPCCEIETILGEIFICLDIVNANADAFGVDKTEELKRVIIHGLLHLLGENHKTNDMQEPMLQKQEKILQQFAHVVL